MSSTDDASRPRRFASPGADEWIGRKIPCLDHGFIYLVDAMGGDPSIVQAARVSYGLGTKTVNEDRGLIRYLMRHDHTTPFEMVELKFHVKLPIFVARQWIRHRTACLSGATTLVFDRPGAPPRGRRQRRGMTIEKFHRLWHQGCAPGRHPARLPMRDRLARMRLRMCDESTGEISSTTVTDIWQSGVKPVFRVTLDNGYSIKMTKDHRCLTERGWMTLAQAAAPQRNADGGVSWDGNAPALAVNGVPAYRDPDWLSAQRGEGLDVRQIAPRGPRLVRTFARISRLELAGHEMTYDLQVSGPYHNFVANGFIVHNSVNEYSGRYSVMPDEFYLPSPEQVTQQSAANRQGGGETVPSERAGAVLEMLREEQRLVREGYEQLLGWDIRRELARINLGVAQYTEWYWKNDLHNIFHFLRLRLDEHAQHEIRVYAEAMATIVRAVAPVAWEAFEDYQLRTVRFTRLELEALARLLAGSRPDEERVLAALPEVWRERGATGALKRNRERDEFLEKLRRLMDG